jgi:hypothetical protein
MFTMEPDKKNDQRVEQALETLVHKRCLPRRDESEAAGTTTADSHRHLLCIGLNIKY